MKYLFPILIAFLLTACDNTPKKQANTAEKVTITDMAGRKVSVPKQINHAFIDRSSVHLIYALDTLLPVNRVFNYNESEKKYLKKGFYEGKPYVTGSPIEEIIKLHPDVILFTVSCKTIPSAPKRLKKPMHSSRKLKFP